MKIFSILEILVGITICCSIVFAALTVKKNPYPSNLWKGIMAEAVGEGYKGMMGVACVHRNRLEQNLSLGCVGLKRKDLNQFVKRQRKGKRLEAQEIVDLVFRRHTPDITNGATHYENVEAFGEPWWAQDMIVVARIGQHTFYQRNYQAEAR